MILKIKQRTDGGYGVTPFDLETGESLGAVFGTKVFASFALAEQYAAEQVEKIEALGDEGSYELVV